MARYRDMKSPYGTNTRVKNCHFFYFPNSVLLSVAADGAARIFSLLLCRRIIREKMVSLGVRTHVSTVGSRDTPDWDL